ncbi:MAG: hydrolase 1, exosortase A system-associated, partial [Bacillota bacterium]
MTHEDHALCFPCRGASLYGVLSLPARPGSYGLLIVVGGPQYRIGSHRQFVLLARAFAAAGYPVFRFDYRGMGDSEGDMRGFAEIDQDMQAAIGQFLAAAPSVQQIVVLGLCDGATAAMLYAHQDRRVSGLVLINPWAHTEAGEAKARLKHYYRARLFAPELWRKITSGNFDYRRAARSLFRSVHDALLPANAGGSQPSLPDRLHRACTLFQGEVLLILCGNDL